MRRVIAAAFMSLDGVMQAPGTPDEDRSGGFEYGGWQAAHWDEVMSAAMGESFKAPFDLLLGRKTYDIFAAHWPRVAEDPEAVGFDEGSVAIASRFNSVTKYVATHSPDTLSWQNSQALGDDVPAAVRRIKQGNGPDLLTQGSSELLQTLLAHDLIDELRLFICPIVLGPGKRLFGSGTRPGALELTKSVISPGGVLILRYERAGEIKVGSFALPQPTTKS